MGRNEATSLEDFPAFSSGMIVATLQIRGQWAIENDELKMDNKSLGPKDRMTWEMKVEYCQGQMLPYLSSFWWQIVVLTCV